jgi:uncharacterized protein (DUF2141 family)
MSKPDFTDIVVNINNIENDKGDIRVQLFDLSDSEAFPEESDKAIRLEITNISDNKAQVTFKDLPYGKYAVTVHHDENLNIKMDKTILGLPAEGWGVSNNIKHLTRVPDFDECSFYADKEITIIDIKLNN